MVCTAQQRAARLVHHLVPCPTAAGSKGCAIITGGSRGIGAAICSRLARDGYAVVVNYQGNRDAAEAVVNDVVKSGGIAKAIQADVSSEAGVQSLFTQVDAAGLPPLTALVNNAGIAISGVDLNKVANEEAYHRQMNINVLGPLLCCREAAKRMGTGNGGKGGAVVNISSGMAYLTGSMLYAMSKAALNAMTGNLVKPFAAEGIRINIVSPGRTDTDMIAGAKMMAIPMGRLGKPAEVADAVAYLLSDGASYTTGANIRVSGGLAPGIHLG